MRWRGEAGLTVPVSPVVAGLVGLVGIAGLVEDHAVTLDRDPVVGDGIEGLDRSYLDRGSCGRWMT